MEKHLGYASLARNLPDAARRQTPFQKEEELACKDMETVLDQFSGRLRLKFHVDGITLRRIGFVQARERLLLPGMLGGVYERLENKRIAIFGSAPGFTDFEVWDAETYEPLYWVRFRISELTEAYNYKRIGVTVADSKKELTLGYHRPTNFQLPPFHVGM